MRAAIREIGAWEMHARGLIFELKGASNSEPDARAVLQTMAQSAEKLIPLLMARD
jgi:hypothetical protein